MFDYQGLTEDELLALCDKRKSRKSWKMKYRASEIYSFGVWYRDYARYPQNKPLYVFSEHGIAFGVVGKDELYNDAEAMFVFSDQKLAEYKRQSKKPCYKVLHPLIWYRRQYAEPAESPKGTLAFPAHTISSATCEFDIDAYSQQLKALPADMQPVCVCLHWLDIVQEKHRKYVAAGLPVYTVGPGYNPRYAEMFYDLLKNFKYTTSNLVGSYAYYSVEMGIPFSLTGEKCVYTTAYHPDFSSGVYEHEAIGNYSEAKALFQGIHREITATQTEHVLDLLGCQGGLSREEMNTILNDAYRKRYFSFKSIKGTVSKLCVGVLVAMIPSKKYRRQIRYWLQSKMTRR